MYGSTPAWPYATPAAGGVVEEVPSTPPPGEAKVPFHHVVVAGFISAIAAGLFLHVLRLNGNRPAKKGA